MVLYKVLSVCMSPPPPHSPPPLQFFVLEKCGNMCCGKSVFLISPPDFFLNIFPRPKIVSLVIVFSKKKQNDKSKIRENMFPRFVFVAETFLPRDFRFLFFFPAQTHVCVSLSIFKWSGVGTTSSRRNCTLRGCVSYHLT